MVTNNIWPDDYVAHRVMMYFPFIYEDAVSCRNRGYGEWIVRLNNGNMFLYDDIWKSIRKLPNDSKSLNKKQTAREIGYRLEKILQRKGLTQSDLSNMTGLTQPQISNYIYGRSMPSFYVVDKIAKALNCSTEDFRYTD